MRGARHRFSRFLTDVPPPGTIAFRSPSDFYREEFLKCRECLEAHREFYSADAISEAERALARAMSQLDRLCNAGDADQIVSDLLRRFDVLTKLIGWTDSRRVH
jgi:hypothetical protein